MDSADELAAVTTEWAGRADGSADCATEWAGASEPLAVPPSEGAAKAATESLKQQLLLALHDEPQGPKSDEEASDGAQAGTRAASSCEAHVMAQLHTIVQDRSGRIADAAAEAVCWEATPLPAELAAELRRHTCVHIGV